MKRFALEDQVLEQVTGGDYGDYSRDYKMTPMYRVGQRIEVYNTPLHISTYSINILECIKDDSGRWKYRIRESEYDTVTADDIER